MRKIIITDKNNVSFVSGPGSAGIDVEIEGQKNVETVDVSHLSQAEWTDMKKSKGLKEKIDKIRQDRKTKPERRVE